MKLLLILSSMICMMGGLAACAHKVAPESAPVANTEAPAPAAGVASASAINRGASGPLICKARKSKFRFDWEAVSPAGADGRIDQNSVSFDFRAANRPAGSQGEHLKVGECGWAASPMTASKKEKSQVSYKKLSDEATETFYKLRTGKVFKLPVRQGKNGLSALPGAPVTIVR